METKFQTSFIPRKPLVQDGVAHRAPSSRSVLMIIGVILFCISIAGAGFTFVAKSYLLSAQEKYKLDLIENEKRFNMPLIQELRRANTKIDFAKQLIKNHVAITETLKIIGALTAEKVSFTDFTISAPDRARNPESGYKITMRGIADSFNSIAFQSDIFGRSQKYGTNKVLKNPILSDLSTDDQGNVKFNFTAEIMPDQISYEKVLTATLQEEGVIPVQEATN